MNRTPVPDHVRFLCRHFVSLGWVDCELNSRGEPRESPRIHNISGFIHLSVAENLRCVLAEAQRPSNAIGAGREFP